MLVSKENFRDVLKQFHASGLYGLDTETTGLWRGDLLFSVILADERDGYYFNFNDKPDHLGNFAPSEFILPRAWLREFEPVLENPASMFFLHNAKFDLGMLAKDGLYVLGAIHDTEVVERVLQNNYPKGQYKLKYLAERRGLKKDATVEEYISKHGLVTKVAVPGKDKPEERKHFDLVPFHIVAPYGATDGIITRHIGMDQIQKITEKEHAAPLQAPALWPLIENERKLTKACFRIEEHGIHIDRPYTQGALAHSQSQARKAMAKFELETGVPFEDSPATLVKVFSKFGIELPKTPTGKPSTNKAVLESLENPVADLIREIRKPLKLCSTYYSSFLFYADDQDLIHANIRQGGTETGRFSYSNPNLQNLPKEDEPEDLEKPYIVRRCFTPPNPEWCFVPIDYRQQEFRLMFDYAGETRIIDQIMAGMDPHEATAQMLGITRKQAKTINFGLLYGMGVDKLARSLKVPFSQASDYKADYFAKFPGVERFIKDVRGRGGSRGYIWNWYGFRNHIARRDLAYILPNHLIQGSGAQVIRIAMVRLDEYMRKNRLRSRMLAQVHDELLFLVHRTELNHVPEFQRIMEEVYTPRNGCKLLCSVEHSWRSWGKCDQIGGLPSEKTRDQIQGKSVG